jgi:hypothetical protein
MVAAKKLQEKKQKGTPLNSSPKIHVPSTPIEPNTPLNALPNCFNSITKSMIVFEETVPDLGRYFYNKSERRIATKSNKRPRMEEVTDP